MPQQQNSQKQIIGTKQRGEPKYLEVYHSTSGIVEWTPIRESAMKFGPAGIATVSQFLKEKKVRFKPLPFTHLPQMED
jgi:hypothetical protein